MAISQKLLLGEFETKKGWYVKCYCPDIFLGTDGKDVETMKDMKVQSRKMYLVKCNDWSYDWYYMVWRNYVKK